VIVSLAARVRLRSARRGSTGCSKKTRCPRFGCPTPSMDSIRHLSAASTWYSNYLCHQKSSVSGFCRPELRRLDRCLALFLRIAEAEVSCACGRGQGELGRAPRFATNWAKKSAAAAFERLISNTLEAQGHSPLVANDPNRLPDVYDPGFHPCRCRPGGCGRRA
jgi:hypothetical protein